MARRICLIWLLAAALLSSSTCRAQSGAEASPDESSAASKEGNGVRQPMPLADEFSTGLPAPSVSGLQAPMFSAPPVDYVTEPPCSQRKRFLSFFRQPRVLNFFDHPFGSYLSAHVNTQILNGVAARMTLYRYDFCDEDSACPASLSPQGKERLSRISSLFLCHGFPIVVEPTPGRPQLDEARRASVVEALRELGLPATPGMVLVRQPEAAGLAGEEAEQIYYRMLQSAQQGATGYNGGASTFVPILTGSGTSE